MIDAFSRVLAAFRGDTFPLDELGAQSLWFAVQDDADFSITPEAFQLRPRGHHEMAYPLDSAPAVVSFLLAGAIGSRSIKTTIPRAPVCGGRFPPFRAPPHHVLAEAWTARVMIRIREHEAALDDELPTLSEKRFARYPHACPSCRQVPERYRVLSEGSLVCLACGASSVKPPGARQL